MKTIKSTVHYSVPHWNFCNEDRLDIGGQVPKQTCRFCIKTRDGHRCMLYDRPLTVDNGLISKTRDCCRASAGFPSEVDSTPQVPTIQPKELMKQTIDVYTKTVDELLKQGYPRQMAEQAAKKHILGG